jgi:hypothetical protein
MNELLANPKGLVILLCFGAVILGLNLSLFGLLRGNKTVQEEASKWGKALSGGQQARRQQDAQLDELHRAVAQFKSQTVDQRKPDDHAPRE